MKRRINANFILYLLSLFDGKLSYTELVSMDLSILFEMQDLKEKELKKMAEKAQRDKNKPENKVIVNRGKK